MARFKNFNGSGKAILATTAQQLQFTGNDLPGGAPGSATNAFHFTMTGTNTFARLTRIRVKSNGNLIYDIDPTHYRAWLERFSPANNALATTAARFSIYFSLLDIEDEDAADLCAFPMGTIPTVELVTDAGTGAGVIYGGWTSSTITPQWYPVLLGQGMNIPASSSKQSYPLQEAGSVRGISLPTVGVDQARLTLNGFDWIQSAGAAYLNVATGDMLLEGEFYDDPETITNPAWLRMPMIPAGNGTSRWELSTQAGWAGTSAETTVWGIRNQGA